MRLHHCSHCGQQVYFENTICMACGSALGFVTDTLQMRAFGPQWADGHWPLLSSAQAPVGSPLSGTPSNQSGTAPGSTPGSTSGSTLGSTPDNALSTAFSTPAPSARWRPCARRVTADLCNWMLPADSPQAHCRSCQLTDPASAGSRTSSAQRGKAELEKRRLLYSLLTLGLPLRPKAFADDLLGLSFRWLSPHDDQTALTAHANGLVSLNLQEVDDVHRESARVQFGESQRTVLGHLRHEVSHHLYQRFVSGTRFMEPFRLHFGDERQDYGQALQRYYANGPISNWRDWTISAYAGSHPWEDWAETCAQYLLIFDAVETAAAWGLQLGGAKPAAPQTPTSSRPMQALLFDDWMPVARFLNAMSRSIGINDSYPYTVAQPLLGKLRFVQEVMQASANA
jgi:hypothetical protein